MPITENSVPVILILSALGLSLLSSGLVLASIAFDQNHNKSYNLKLIFRLLLCDFCINIVILSCFILQILLISSSHKSTTCSICLPTIYYFLLSSFSWTIMISLRFLISDPNSKTNYLSKYISKIKLWWIWLGCFVLMIPTIVFNAIGNKVLSSTDKDSPVSCAYDHEYTNSIVVDIVTVQFPLVVTVIINIASYIIGMKALKDSPQSVVARHMRRAGGYLLVLVIVWLPILAFNVLSITLQSNSEFIDLFYVGLFLLSSQGYLNVLVYVLSDKKLKRWLIQSLCIYKLCCCIPGMGDEEKGNNAEDFRESDDDSYDIDIDLEATFSSSDIGTTASNKSDPHNASFTSSEFTTVNPIRSSMHSQHSRYQKKKEENSLEPRITESKLKSGLTNKRNSATTKVRDLDSEKYVRFGGVSTNVFTNSFSSFVSSLRSSLSSVDERNTEDGRNDFVPNIALSNQQL